MPHVRYSSRTRRLALVGSPTPKNAFDALSIGDLVPGGVDTVSTLFALLGTDAGYRNIADTSNGYVAEMEVEGLGRLVFDDVCGTCLLRDKDSDDCQRTPHDSWTRGSSWWPDPPCDVMQHLNGILARI